ncbi:MAG: hypothetical protein COX07_00940 [Bacteroidetes bacterium CG23_combo_of_CG06-09_8_20_14_all_32_9]|nr:MAG: hypothetical protein COX07_00940 [Bacteroidetes bacterium CG23_combo_of_CG06-09_8_20_14_all_32_9]
MMQDKIKQKIVHINELFDKNEKGDIASKVLSFLKPFEIKSIIGLCGLDLVVGVRRYHFVGNFDTIRNLVQFFIFCQLPVNYWGKIVKKLKKMNIFDGINFSDEVVLFYSDTENSIVIQ